VVEKVGYECNFNHLDLYLVGGGEPLMKFDNIKEIVSFAEARFQSVCLHIVTNGTFDDKVLDWLTTKKCSIRISFDGVSQDLQRPYRDSASSSSLIVKTRFVGKPSSFFISLIVVPLASPLR